MFTQEAIKELTRAEAISAASDAISGKANAVVALPNDFELLNLEQYLGGRTRARGSMTTTIVAAFARYTTAHAQEGATVFIDPKGMKAVSVLNLGTPEAPGHADDTATFQAEKTAAYASLLKIVGEGRKQATIAEFLEDWAPNVECFNDEGTISVPQAVAAVRRITIENLRKLESAEQQLSAERSTFDSVSAKSADPLPTIVYFKTEPYKGLSQRTFAMRLGILTGGQAPLICLRLIAAEVHEEQMALELCELVNNAITTANTEGKDLPVLVGTYAAR